MDVRDYYPDDYHMISKWCSLRYVPVPPVWSFPPTGVIVPDVACGFLLKMNNQCAIMDFFISNPEASKEDRADAFDLIVEDLELSAKEAGIKMLLANSNIAAIQEMAQKHNYSFAGNFVHFMKEL